VYLPLATVTRPGKLWIVFEATHNSDKCNAQLLAACMVLTLDMLLQAQRPTARQREHRTLVRHRRWELYGSHLNQADKRLR
jgi:hypothetical protein